jgi:transposase
LVKSSKTFFRVGVGDQEAKSLRGIQRTQRDAVCRAPKWLKSSFQKLSDKCGAKGTIAYAPAHEDISYRPFRRRVRAHRATPTRRLPAGTSQDPPSARHLRCRVLRPEERLSMVVAATGVPALEDRLPSVPSLAHRRYLGAAQRCAARGLAGAVGQEPQAQRRDSGLSVGQDHRGRRQRAWLRPRQEGGRHSKRHLLVDTGGLVLEARVHSARVPDQDGIRLLLDPACDRLRLLSHLWVDAGYQGRGRRWTEEVLGVSVEIVRKPRKPLPEEVAKIWAREWAKEGIKVDWQSLMPPRGFKVLLRRWVVERTFSWLGQNRRMSKDYERLPESSEAFIYAAMTRLMVRRLARG